MVYSLQDGLTVKFGCIMGWLINHFNFRNYTAMNENSKRTVQKLSRYVWKYRHIMYTKQVTGAMKHRRYCSQSAVELQRTQQTTHPACVISTVFFQQTTRKCYVTRKLSSPKHPVPLSTGNTVQRGRNPQKPRAYRHCLTHSWII